MHIMRLLSKVPSLQVAIRRHYGASAVLLQKASDPIQQLFVDKIREYAKKKKTSGSQLVDSTPATEKQLKQELEKIDRHYSVAAGSDMTKFPEFKFSEPKVDPLFESK